MKSITAYRKGDRIEPRSMAAALEIRRLPEGLPLRVTVSQRRNGRYHRLVFAMFSLVAEALSNGPAAKAKWDTEDVLRNVKVALGYADLDAMTARQVAAYGLPAGTQAYVATPQSVAFDKMGEDEFGAFARAAADYIAGHLCPYIRDSPEWPQVAEILDQMQGRKTAA